MLTSPEFPVKIEVLFTMFIDDRYFVAGQRYEAIAWVKKQMDCNACDNLIKYKNEIVSYWVIKISEKIYELPVIGCGIIPHSKSLEGINRLQHIIDASEGELGIRDHVKAAKDLLGIDITMSGPDFDRRALHMLPLVQDKSIPKIIENLDEQITQQLKSNIVQKDQARVFINIVSAVIRRGNEIEYQIYLNQPPEDEVTINISSGNSKINIYPQSIVFTKMNFDYSQNIIIGILEGSEPITQDEITIIVHNATGKPFEGKSLDTISILIKKDL